MIDAHGHPPPLGGDVVDPVRNRLAQLLVLEVMHPYQLRLALGSPLAPRVLEIPDQLLLLGVDRDDRLVLIDCPLGDRVDVPELRVAIRMLSALPSLDVCLQVLAKPAHQLRNLREVHLMTEPAQAIRKMPDTPRGPAENRLWIAPAASINQTLEILEQRQIDLRQRLATTARPTHSPRRQSLPSLKLADPLADRRLRHSGRARRGCYSTTPRRARLAGCPQSTLPLVQVARRTT